MASSALRKGIFVVAGVGSGGGTGLATAKLFAKSGYSVALIARSQERLDKIASDLKTEGIDAAGFAVANYNQAELQNAFAGIKSHWPNEDVRVALWNAASGTWKPFLELTEEEILDSLNNNILGAFAFSRAAILSFKDLPPNEHGARGALIHTGATASIRGNKTTASFAAGKHGLRALSQSLAKEFGKQDIHVAHAIIDGAIDSVREGRGPRPADLPTLSPNGIAKAYLYLAEQDKDSWTWELDLRPSKENW